MPKPESRQPKSAVLCLNSGSSSLKFSLYQIGREKERLLVDGLAVPGERRMVVLDYFQENGSNIKEKINGVRRISDAAGRILQIASERCRGCIAAAGHRFVHGGGYFNRPVLIDNSVKRKLEAILPLSPLHGPESLSVVEKISNASPELPQTACFDTSFHGSLPDQARHYALPRPLRKNGVRKYGFHGLSCEYSITHLTEKEKKKAVICHLGSGASVTAVKDGRSVDTSMGMTPAGGIMMGTRCGDLDPGVILYLMREKKMSLPQVEKLVNYESGLLGVSGISSDMKVLIKKCYSTPEALEAVEMFCYRIRSQIGAYFAILGGLTSLVFTGGIGEKSPALRLAICRPLKHLGISLEKGPNTMSSSVISAPGANCSIRVIKARENLVIARRTMAVLEKDELSR
ncbi:acetate/propionate family kinase [Fibrobacterota bacterium]